MCYLKFHENPTVICITWRIDAFDAACNGYEYYSFDDSFINKHHIMSFL